MATHQWSSAILVRYSIALLIASFLPVETSARSLPTLQGEKGAVVHVLDCGKHEVLPTPVYWVQAYGQAVDKNQDPATLIRAELEEAHDTLQCYSMNNSLAASTSLTFMDGKEKLTMSPRKGYEAGNRPKDEKDRPWIMLETFVVFNLNYHKAQEGYAPFLDPRHYYDVGIGDGSELKNLKEVPTTDAADLAQITIALLSPKAVKDNGGPEFWDYDFEKTYDEGRTPSRGSTIDVYRNNIPAIRVCFKTDGTNYDTRGFRYLLPTETYGGGRPCVLSYGESLGWVLPTMDDKNTMRVAIARSYVDKSGDERKLARPDIVDVFDVEEARTKLLIDHAAIVLHSGFGPAADKKSGRPKYLLVMRAVNP